jgi:hypothetical protein
MPEDGGQHQDSGPAREQKTPIVRSQGVAVPSLYVNSAQFAVGALEIRIYLSETTPNRDTASGGPGEGVIVTEKLCLVLPPEFAKNIGDNLVKTMELYEKNFGKLRDISPISVPPTT